MQQHGGRALVDAGSIALAGRADGCRCGLRACDCGGDLLPSVATLRQSSSSRRWSAAFPNPPVGHPPSTVIQNANRLGSGRPVRGADKSFRSGKGRYLLQCVAAPLANHLRNAPPEPNKLKVEDHLLALLGTRHRPPASKPRAKTTS